MDTSAQFRSARPINKAFLLLAGLAVATIPVGALMAQPAQAPFTIVENGQGFARLQDAVDAIGNGDGTIAVSSGNHRQCAVQTGGDITYLATEPGKAVFDGVTCEGKAALVLRGRSASISGLTFQNMAVPDFNGSGIRLEQGHLTVVQSWFRDSQQGILSANDPASRIVIDKSTFSGLGTCDGPGGCAHSLYIGDYGHLRVTRSRFEKGRGGHYIKARARRVEIASSSFDDSQGRATNYMIDLPNGAQGQISNNWFVQGRDKENYSAFITIAPEGREQDSTGLLIAGNDARFATGVSRQSTFVANWTDDNVSIGPNRLGPGLRMTERR